MAQIHKGLGCNRRAVGSLTILVEHARYPVVFDTFPVLVGLHRVFEFLFHIPEGVVPLGLLFLLLSLAFGFFSPGPLVSFILLAGKFGFECVGDVLHVQGWIDEQLCFGELLAVLIEVNSWTASSSVEVLGLQALDVLFLVLLTGLLGMRPNYLGCRRAHLECEIRF